MRGPRGRHRPRRGQTSRWATLLTAVGLAAVIILMIKGGTALLSGPGPHGLPAPR